MPLVTRIHTNRVSPQIKDNLHTANNTTRYKWYEDRSEEFRNLLHGQSAQALLEQVNLNLQLNELDAAVEKIGEMLEMAAAPMRQKPRQRVNTPNNQEEWFDLDCKQAKKVLSRSLHKYRRVQCENNWKIFKQAKLEYKALVRAKRRAHRENMRTKLRTVQRDPKEFWRLVKGKKVNSMGNIGAQEFANYFEGLYNESGEDYTVEESINITELLQNMLSHSDQFIDSLDEEITEQEILDSVKNLKTGKASGIDNLLPEFFKESISVLLPYLKILFNKCFNFGVIPRQWTVGIINPLFKSGRKDEVENYRSITLLSVFGKLFLTILGKRLNNWGESGEKLVESQMGFRKGYGVLDNLFCLNSIVNKYLTRPRGRFYCAFVDFSKAFDSVNRAYLWIKLLQGGLSTKMVKLVQALYEEVKSCVRINEEISGMFNCTKGVRQGCILSPFLFAFFIRDLDDHLKQSGCRGIQVGDVEILSLMFADDLALCADSVIGLQRVLNALNTYCSKWQLTVNLVKTKVMVFRNGGKLKRTEKWYYCGKKVDVVNSYKYLGITISSSGRWFKAQETLAAQASKATFLLKKRIHKFGAISPELVFKLFDTMILPVLMYGCEIWGFHTGNQLEIVHNKFCKFYLGVGQNTPNIAVRGELGRHPLYVLRYSRIIKFWLKVLEMDNNRYTKKCYRLMYELDQVNRKSWVSQVKQLLFAYGLQEAWFNQGVGNIEECIHVFKKRVKRGAIQAWNNQIEITARLQTYCTVKDRFNVESYLNVINVINHRKALSQLRCSSHALNIEKGRHNKTRREARLCQLCEEGLIEDEYHFVMECPFFNALRKEHLPSFYVKRPDPNKFRELMKGPTVNTTRQLGRFVYKAFILRQQCINVQHSSSLST
ncbi:uncharacterized protein LOC144879949 [Branchiostoma floridae x Branchiostoma japonicum]